MKLYSFTIQNFRGYKDPVTIIFDNLTAIVGRNDIGKSTILEALDIFFNEGKGCIKIEEADINKDNHEQGNNEIEFCAEFINLPENLILDRTFETNLNEEKILNEEGRLCIIKRYPNAGKEKVFIRSYHPTNPACADLYNKKPADLRQILDDNQIACNDRTVNALMRQAIWRHFENDLQLQLIDIDVTKGDVKTIWDRLRIYLPYYVLFQCDRSNTDGDKEVQDPLKEAVKQLMASPDIQQRCNEIAERVRERLQEVSSRTLIKLREMNPELANQLNPSIPETSTLKWPDVFKAVSITGDNDIPINKHGSGVKRLILLNFFRAEVERRLAEQRAQDATIPTNAIYAIEEPETSQHAEHQRILMTSFIALANQPNNQIVITTHSNTIVKRLEYDNIRLVAVDEHGNRRVENIQSHQLPFKSMNEINYLAFGEVSEEYHIELYTHIKETGQWNAYINGKQTIVYMQLKRDGNLEQKNIVLTEYIRNLIHHPENTNNRHYTEVELKQSIEMMRAFLGL